ncbi:MAG: hypothetical protein ACLVG7_01610 [Negativibacillus sp.]
MADNQARFSKEDLVKSKKYQHRRDLLNAILEDDKKYTIQEVDSKIEKFMKGRA